MCNHLSGTASNSNQEFAVTPLESIVGQISRSSLEGCGTHPVRKEHHVMGDCLQINRTIILSNKTHVGSAIPSAAAANVCIPAVEPRFVQESIDRSQSEPKKMHDHTPTMTGRMEALPWTQTPLVDGPGKAAAAAGDLRCN